MDDISLYEKLEQGLKAWTISKQQQANKRGENEPNIAFNVITIDKKKRLLLTILVEGTWKGIIPLT